MGSSSVYGRAIDAAGNTGDCTYLADYEDYNEENPSRPDVMRYAIQERGERWSRLTDSLGQKWSSDPAHPTVIPFSATMLMFASCTLASSSGTGPFTGRLSHSDRIPRRT